jgi:cellobiose-specific phosphotransferase system component IIC
MASSHQKPTKKKHHATKIWPAHFTRVKLRIIIPEYVKVLMQREETSLKIVSITKGFVEANPYHHNTQQNLHIKMPETTPKKGQPKPLLGSYESIQTYDGP